MAETKKGGIHTADSRVVIDVSINVNQFIKDAKRVQKATAAEGKKVASSFTKIASSGEKAGKKAGKGLQKGISSGVSAAEGKINGLKGALSGIATAIGGAYIFKKAFDVGKEAVELASDMQEVQNVVDTAFGDMAYKAEEFAATSIEQFGMSQLAAKKTSSTYMAMARGMGLAEEDASDMAISLAGLTGDVASFYNISQDEASTKLKSIFTGETESLKDLGVVMTQANLNAFAMANGFGTTIDKMNQAQQTQLRYMYVTQQLSLAQGDFAKTSGSWANQTRILSEQWKQFLSIIGNGLIQALTPAIQALNQFLGVLIQWAQEISQVIAGIFGVETSSAAAGIAVEGMADGISSAAEAENDLASSTAKAAKEAQKQSASFDEMNIMQAPSSGTSGASGGSASTSVPALSLPSAIGANMTVSPNVDRVAESIKQKFQALSDWFSLTFAPSISSWGSAFSNLQTPIQTAFLSITGSVSNLWQNTLLPFGQYLTGTWIPDIVNTFSTTFAPIFSDVLSVLIEEFGLDFAFVCTQIQNLVNDILLPAFEGIRQVFSDVCAAISSTWEEYGAGLLEGFQRFKESLRQIWQSLYDNIFKPIFEGIGNTISWLWDKHLKYLWQNITDFVASVSEMIMTIWNNFLAPIVDWIVKTFGPSIANIINRIGDVIGTVFAVISDVVGGVIEAFTGLSDFITGVFSGNWNKAWEGIKKFFKGIWDAIWGIVKGVVNLIIDGINMLWTGIYNAIKAIVNSVGSIAGAIGSLFGQDWHFSMPEKPPLIPKLARGAVIPANREFLAVLGDQKSGRNLEAPESLIRQIVREESGADSGPVYITLQLGHQKFAQAVLESLREAGKQSGGISLRLA